jgi:hypothetical protein
MVRIESSALYAQLKAKYNNEKIMVKIMEFIGTIVSSSFEMIDWDEANDCPASLDGEKVPMINDIINEELMFFISTI